MAMQLNVVVNPVFNQAQYTAAGAAAGSRYAAGFNSSFSRTQPLGRITGQVTEFEKSMEAANARVLAFGASAGSIYVIKSAFDKLVSSTIEVEKALADINVVLGLGSTSLKTFSNEMFKAAAQTGQTFETASKVALEFARHGVSAAETAKRMTAAMELMRISGLSAGESVDSITASLNAFSKEALTAEDIVNRLTAVDTKFAVSAQDLAKAIQRVGAVADDAGVQFNQLLGLVTAAQTVTARGGAVIGNAFKSIFTRLGRPQVLEDLEAVGVTTRTAAGQVLPMITILKNLASSYNTLGSAQRSFISEAVGGVYQVNILKAAISDLGNGISIFDKATLAASDSAGQIEQRMAALNETISSKLNVSAVQMVKLFSNIGQTAFGSGAKSGIDTFNKNISLISSSLDNIEPDDSTGEKIGKTLAQGIAKGLGAVLSGPGMQIAAVLLTKVFANIGKFAIESSRDFMGANDALNKQKDIVSSIQTYLTKNPAILDQIKNGQINVNQAHLHFLSQLQQEAQLRAQNASIAGTMARSAAPYINPTKVRPASGYIPNFSADDDSHIEKRLALAHGYTAGPTYQTKIYPGKGAAPQMVTVNQRESVKTVVDQNGDKATFVIPPNGFGADTIRAGQGFVPNFALKPINTLKGKSAGNLGDVYDLNNPIDQYNLIGNVTRKGLPFTNAEYDYKANSFILDAIKNKFNISNSIYNGQKLGKYLPIAFKSDTLEKGNRRSNINNVKGALAEIDTYSMLRGSGLNPAKLKSKYGADFAAKSNGQVDLFETKATQKAINDDVAIAKALMFIGRTGNYKGNNVDDKINLRGIQVFQSSDLMASGFIPNFANLRFQKSLEEGGITRLTGVHGKNIVGDIEYSGGSIREIEAFDINEKYRGQGLAKQFYGAMGKGKIKGTLLPNYDKNGNVYFPQLSRANTAKSASITHYGPMEDDSKITVEQFKQLIQKNKSNKSFWDQNSFDLHTSHAAGHIPNFEDRKISSELYEYPFRQMIRGRPRPVSAKEISAKSRDYELSLLKTGLPSLGFSDIEDLNKVFHPSWRADFFARKNSAPYILDAKAGYNDAKKSKIFLKEDSMAELLKNPQFIQYLSAKGISDPNSVHKGFIFGNMQMQQRATLAKSGKLMAGGHVPNFGASNMPFGSFTSLSKSGLRGIMRDPSVLKQYIDKDGTLRIPSTMSKDAVGLLGSLDKKDRINILKSLGVKRIVGSTDPDVHASIGSHPTGYGTSFFGASAGGHYDRTLAAGHIPNFATNNGYLNKVMGLETKMSGRSAIFDTKPFPHIRNASQPTFESAIADHGGLSNALGDSMRNQKKSGVLGGGFVPNFGIEESLMLGVIQAASGNIKGKMDALSFGYDRQISKTQKLYESFDKLNNEITALKGAGGTRALSAEQRKKRAELHQERTEIMASFQQEAGFSIRDRGRRANFQSLNTAYQNRLEESNQRVSRAGGITSVVAPIAGGIASSIASTAGAPDLSKGLSTMSEGIGLAGQAMMALPPKLGIIAGVGIAAYKLSEGMKEMKSGAEAAKVAYENQKTVIERTSGALNSLQQSYESMDSLYKSGTASLSSFLIVSKRLSQSMAELAAVSPELAQKMQQARTPEERARVQARFMDESNLKGQQLAFAAEFAQIRKENAGPLGLGNIASGAAQGQFTATSKTEVPIMENRKAEAAQVIRNEILKEMEKTQQGAEFSKQFTQRLGEGTATKEEAATLLQGIDKSETYQSLGDENTKKAAKEKLQQILDVLTIPADKREAYIAQLNQLGDAQRKEANIRKQYNQELQNYLNKGTIKAAFGNQQTEQGLQQQGREIGTKYAQEEAGFGVKSLVTSDVDMLKMRGAAKQGEISERTGNEVALIKQRSGSQIGSKLAETISEGLTSSMTTEMTGKTGAESRAISETTKRQTEFLSGRQAIFSGQGAQKLQEMSGKSPQEIAEAFLGNRKEVIGKKAGQISKEEYENLSTKIQTQVASPDFQKQSGDTLTEIKNTLEKGNEEAKTAAAENLSAIKQAQFKELAGALGGLGLLAKGGARQERRKIRRAEYLSEHGRTAESRGRGAAELLSLIPESRRNVNDPYISRLYGQTQAGLRAADSRVLAGTRLGASGAMGNLNQMAFAQTFGNLKASGMGEDFYQKNGLSMPPVDTGPLDSSIQRAAKDIDNFGEMLNRLGSRKDALLGDLKAAEQNTIGEAAKTTDMQGGAATTPKPPEPDTGLGWKKTVMNGLSAFGPALGAALVMFLMRGKGGGLGKLGAATAGAGAGAVAANAAATAAGTGAAGAAGAATAAGAAASTAALTAQMGVAGKKTGVMNSLASATLNVAKADKIQAISTAAATEEIIASGAASSKAAGLGAKVAGSAAGQSAGLSNLLKKAFAESGQAIKTEIVTPFMKMKPMRAAKGFVGGLMGGNLTSMGLGAGSHTNIIGKMFRAGNNIRNVVGAGGQAASTFSSPITTGINRVGQTYKAFTGALGGANNLAAMGLGKGSMSFLPRTAFNLGGKINAVGGAIAEPFSLAATRASQTYNAFTGGVGGAKNLAAMGLGKGSMSFLPRTAFKIGQEISPAFQSASKIISPFGKVASAIGGKVTSSVGNVAASVGGRVGGGILGKALPLLGSAVGGYFGAQEAEGEGMSKTEGAAFGVLTGGARQGSIFGQFGLVEQGGRADKALGVAGAAVNGALLGGAIGSFAGPGGTAIGAGIGAAVGGGAEVYKQFRSYRKESKEGEIKGKALDEQRKALIDSRKSGEFQNMKNLALLGEKATPEQMTQLDEFKTKTGQDFSRTTQRGIQANAGEYFAKTRETFVANQTTPIGTFDRGGKTMGYTHKFGNSFQTKEIFDEKKIARGEYTANQKESLEAFAKSNKEYGVKGGKTSVKDMTLDEKKSYLKIAYEADQEIKRQDETDKRKQRLDPKINTNAQSRKNFQEYYDKQDKKNQSLGDNFAKQATTAKYGEAVAQQAEKDVKAEDSAKGDFKTFNQAVDKLNQYVQAAAQTAPQAGDTKGDTAVALSSLPTLIATTNQILSQLLASNQANAGRPVSIPPATPPP